MVHLTHSFMEMKWHLVAREDRQRGLGPPSLSVFHPLPLPPSSATPFSCSRSSALRLGLAAPTQQQRQHACVWTHSAMFASPVHAGCAAHSSPPACGLRHAQVARNVISHLRGGSGGEGQKGHTGQALPQLPQLPILQGRRKRWGGGQWAACVTACAPMIAVCWVWGQVACSEESLLLNLLPQAAAPNCLAHLTLHPMPGPLEMAY